MPNFDISAAPLWRRPNLSAFAWFGFGAVILAVAFATRYLWIEPSAMGLACAAVPPPWWCAPRTAIILVHQYNGWGLAALAGGLSTLLFRWRWAAVIGLGAGLMGLVLYNTGLAAVGVLFTLLRLLRR